MSTFTESPNTLHDTALEPLRASRVAIVALGVVFVIAGIIPLGSVVMATAARVRRRHHDGDRRRRRSHQRLPDRGPGRVSALALAGALYIVAGFLAFEAAWPAPF